MTITYHAVFQFDPDGICISFPDAPLAITCADTPEKGIAMAKDVLILALHKTAAADLPADTAARMNTESNQELVPITVEMEVRDGILFHESVIDLR